MYVVKRLLRPDGSPAGAIIPLTSIRQSCMLIPNYGNKAQPDLTKENVLDTSSSFFLNSWTSLYTYKTIW